MQILLLVAVVKCLQRGSWLREQPVQIPMKWEQVPRCPNLTMMKMDYRC